MLIMNFSNCFKKIVPRFSRKLSCATGKCKIEQLKERGLLRVTGKDSAPFLQGLMTNDMRLLESGQENCIYTMFLNTKGRVLYDALIFNDPKGGFLIECDMMSVDGLIKHVNMYRLRKKVEFTMDNQRAVKVVFGEVENKEITEDNIFVKDPRLPDLGFRLISTPNYSVPCDPVQGLYKETRYKLGVAEGEAEFARGDLFPLEMNLDYLNGVSFDKGCYLGQELTARTKHTGVIRKRLMPLEFSSSIPSSKELVEQEPGGNKVKRLGKIRAVYGSLGLGLIRISDMDSPALISAGITVQKPTWWHDHQNT